MIFKDNCNNSNAVFKTICSIFVFIMVLGFIYNIIMSIYLYNTCDNYKNHRGSQLLYTIFNFKCRNSLIEIFCWQGCQISLNQ